MAEGLCRFADAPNADVLTAFLATIYLSQLQEDEIVQTWGKGFQDAEQRSVDFVYGPDLHPGIGPRSLGIAATVIPWCRDARPKRLDRVLQRQRDVKVDGGRVSMKQFATRKGGERVACCHARAPFRVFVM